MPKAHPNLIPMLLRRGALSPPYKPYRKPINWEYWTLLAFFIFIIALTSCIAYACLDLLAKAATVGAP